MSDFDPLADAIIEDTVHCDFCGASWTLGGNEDGIALNNPHGLRDDLPAQLKFCMDCAAFIARVYTNNVYNFDFCRHGVCNGDWCDECHAEFRRREDR